MSTTGKARLPSGISLAYILQQPTTPPPAPKAAIIAHPYGRLGGAKEDHVLAGVARVLVEDGWTVLSGIPEAEDYEYLVKTILLPLEPTQLALIGYSFGSLCASICPPPTSIPTRYVLISYPLSVMWALTAFRSSSFTSGLKERVATNDVLAVFGDEDNFSGVGKLRAWSEGLGEGTERFKSVEVEGADHFWREREVKMRLLGEVREWLRAEW
ncbi:alpha/beta hydrolase, N-terminal domain protein [Pseudohyphozyma bogoriensis]|nr:alpha/beta hydrolase, N-terminal domain protein [Pseudohyphozyma bogoriensis]